MNKSRVSIIAAVDEKRGIGKNNDLLFKIPEDLRRFKELTSGHAVIMGWKTFKSIGRELPNRLNILLTRDLSKQKELNKDYVNSVIYHDIKFALKRAASYEREKNNDPQEIFIIGGGQIFNIALEKKLVDRIYLTEVEGDFEADVFFPDYSKFTKVISEENREADGYRYKYLTLERD